MTKTNQKAIIRPAKPLQQEYERPFLSRPEKEILIQRDFHSLMGYHRDRAHSKLKWSHHQEMEWVTFVNSHLLQRPTIIEVVDSHKPVDADHMANLTHYLRQNYGRIHFQISRGLGTN